MLGVFLDRASVDVGDLDLSHLVSTLPSWNFYDQTDIEDVAERIAGAQVVVSNKVPLGADTLRGSDSLQLICVAATGTNNIDLEVARERGVQVCNVRAYATPAVVQHTFALMLALATRLTDYREWVRAGKWPASPMFCSLDFPVREMVGKKLGIIGYGELGKGVAAVARAFGMEVLVAQRPGNRKPVKGRTALRDLLPQVDVLTLHCPLTGETRGLLGAAELSLMKPGAVLINTARGGIVDEDALADALRSGHLGGAGVDVLTEEPPRHGNPLLDNAIPNLIVTPHVAWASREARQRLVDELVANVHAFSAGEVRNAVV